MVTVDIRKGTRLRARWFDAKTSPPASLAGVHLKFSATERVVTGVVTRIRGDDPLKPATVRLWVKPDDGGDDVEIRPEWVVEVLSCQ